VGCRNRVLITVAGVTVGLERNPHAAAPFTDDDAAIEAALQDVSVPALLCSLVHMTGDPSWIRGDLRPQHAVLNDYTGGMSPEMLAEARRRALPAVIAYRDAGCEPHVLPQEVIEEMMGFIGAGPLDPDVIPMFLEDLHLDGGDSRAIAWGDEISDDVKAASPVVVIGCGESGLLAGIRLAQAGLPFTIVEKGAGAGGTWWDNRYPGARVDIGSHFYCYSFEPADHWSEYFCQQPELRDYFARVLDKFGIREHCRFSTEVTAATYDEATGRWSIEVRGPDGAVDVLDARFVISGVGSLNLPRLPDIPGMDEFQGPSFHSARWPADLDWRGTRFALVGAGASGFQIAPTIADDVAELTVFQRTAQWMFPNANYHRAVPEGDAWAMRHLPFYGRWFRFLMFYPAAGLSMDRNRMDPNFDSPDGSAVSETNAFVRQVFGGWITSQLDDRPDLVEKCLPPYPPTAKRTLQDNGSWLGCLKKPNVELVRTPIERIVADGVVTVDGHHYPADVICYATGFRHNEFLAPMGITGRGGADLRTQFGDEPTAYLGITIKNFPNLFCLYGPGTNLAHGASLIFQSECQVHYVMEAIHGTLAGGHTTIEVKPEVHDEYAERYSSEIAQMVWAHPSVEHSHFKNKDGKIFTLSPWPIPTYWRWTHAVDPSDYTFG
jgi:4-hydroxyacetophenone monooxygenase